jgi:hypothetical protein
MPCREISDGTETTAQATPDLSNTEKHLVHGFEDIEGYHIGRVSVNSLRLNFLNDHSDGSLRQMPRVQLKGDSESQIWPVARNLPNNGAYEAKI